MHNFIHVYLHARSSIHISQYGAAEPLTFFVGFSHLNRHLGNCNDGNRKKVISPILGDEGSDADMGAVIVDAKRLFPNIVEEKLINHAA